MESKDLLGIGAVILTLGLIISNLVRRISIRRYHKSLSRDHVPKNKPSKEELERERELERLDNERRQFYSYLQITDEEFVNKNTTSLEDFIINDDLNHLDLKKLAELNGINVQMANGWYDLTLDLVRELDQLGWNKKVGSIKEKFGELRFYADTEHEDVLDKYTEKSKTICEMCGKPGKFYTVNAWDFTRCDAHRHF